MTSTPYFPAVPRAAARAPRAGSALAALALCVFAIGAGEYVVAGMLPGAPTLAAATNVAAFNLANTIGAAIGGLIAATVGLAWTAPVGGLITFGGLALAVVVLHPLCTQPQLARTQHPQSPMTISPARCGVPPSSPSLEELATITGG